MTLIALNTSKEQQVRDGPRKDRAAEGRADLFLCVCFLGRTLKNWFFQEKHEP